MTRVLAVPNKQTLWGKFKILGVPILVTHNIKFLVTALSAPIINGTTASCYNLLVGSLLRKHLITNLFTSLYPLSLAVSGWRPGMGCFTPHLPVGRGTSLWDYSPIIIIIIIISSSSRIFYNVTVQCMGLLRLRVVFGKVAVTKTKSRTIAFISSPPFLRLALSFSPFIFLRSLLCLELLEHKKPAFRRRLSRLFSQPKWLQISLGWVSKKTVSHRTLLWNKTLKNIIKKRNN